MTTKRFNVFTCANARCQAPLNVDHVTLITTAHVRRFCSVECIAEGQEAYYDRIFREAGCVTAAQRFQSRAPCRDRIRRH